MDFGPWRYLNWAEARLWPPSTCLSLRSGVRLTSLNVSLGSQQMSKRCWPILPQRWKSLP